MCCRRPAARRVLRRGRFYRAARPGRGADGAHYASALPAVPPDQSRKGSGACRKQKRRAMSESFIRRLLRKWTKRMAPPSGDETACGGFKRAEPRWSILPEKTREQYRAVLHSFLPFRDTCARIPLDPRSPATDIARPGWRNHNLSPLEALSLLFPLPEKPEKLFRDRIRFGDPVCQTSDPGWAPQDDDDRLRPADPPRRSGKSPGRPTSACSHSGCLRHDNRCAQAGGYPSYKCPRCP